MSEVSKDEFIASIVKSGVIEESRFKEWLDASQSKSDSAKAIAKGLIRDELLTNWQAKYLMSGRNRLDIGNYRLLERTSRDELGDRFLAMHTSLARKVDLQVLPSQTTKDKDRCKAFLKKATQVAKLDHQNLIHVYDIDQEGGRYFLVTEFVEATALDQAPRNKIMASDVASIIGEALVGIQHAHANGIVHGGLLESDLLLVKDECVKVQNLAVSPLRSVEESDAVADLKAIKKIGIQLLKQIPESKHCEEYPKVGKLLVNFKPEVPDSLEETIFALSIWSKAPVVEPEATLEPEPLIDVGSGGFDQPFDSPVTPLVSPVVKRKKKALKSDKSEGPTEETDEAPKGYMGRLWENNPVAVIATAAVLALGLCCGTAFGVYSAINNDDTIANVDNNSNQPITNTSAKGAQKDPSKPPSESDIDAALAKFSKGKGATEKGPPKDNKKKDPNPDPDPTPPAEEKNRNPKDNTKGNTTPKTEPAKKEPEATPPIAKVDPAKTEPNKGKDPDDATTVAMNPDPKDNTPNPAEASRFEIKEDIRGIGDATKTALARGDVTTVEQLAKLSASDVKQALMKAGWTRDIDDFKKYEDWISQAKSLLKDTSPIKASTGTTPVVAENSNAPKPNPKGQFLGFPRLTQLPAITDTTEKRIGGLVISQAYLLGLEMICDPGICKTKLIFELTRTPDDKQKWLVGVKRSARKKPENVGIFRKSKDAFFFKWLPEAVDNKYSEFLRNCHLKLKLPDKSAAYLSLRTPIKIHDLRLTAESLSNVFERAIPAMPHPDNIVIEVLPMRVPKLTLDTVISYVEQGSPGRIMLEKRDSKGFMWIQVDAEMKSKLKIESSLKGRIGNRISSISSMEGVNQFIGTLRQMESQAAVANNQKQQQKAAKGKKGELDKEKAQYQSLAKQSKDATNKSIRYKDILSKTVNKPISIRVFAKFGALQTEILQTDSKLPQPAKRKKKKKK